MTDDEPISKPTITETTNGQSRTAAETNSYGSLDNPFRAAPSPDALRQAVARTAADYTHIRPGNDPFTSGGTSDDAHV